MATSEALAEAFLQLFTAESCTVSLLDEGGYHDVVNVGKLAPHDQRFPDPDYRYPLEQFPLSTELLLARTGYLSVDTRSALYKVFQGMWPQMPAGSFMGVPIVARGTVRGEIYLARNVSQPGFTGEDVDVAKDLATTFGSALTGLLSNEAEDQ